MRTLALIPARAGSKGIPHKNTREFKGLPLLAHAIRVGLEMCDQTVVSTDDVAAATIAAQYNVAVLQRPAELAQDDTPMLPVIQHVLSEAWEQPDVIVLLQPSSPTVRRAEYVREALRIVEPRGVGSIASVVEIPERYNPDRALWITDGGLSRYDKPEGDGDMGSMPACRQHCEPGYYLDGTVYAVKRRHVPYTLYGDPCRPLIIPASDSVTLDTEADWPLGEAKHG